MATADDYLSILQPSDDERRQAATRALMMAAAAAFQSNDGRLPIGSILGRTMFAGLGGYDDSVGQSRKDRMDQFLARKQAFELAEADRKLADQKALAEAMRSAAVGQQTQPFTPGTRQSMAFAPEVNAALPAAPAPGPALDPREQRRRILQNTIDGLVAKGRGDMVGPLQDQLLKLQDEFATEPRYDQKGNAFLVSKQGAVKPLSGITARDEIVADNLGGTTNYRTKYDLSPLGRAAHTVDPGTVYSQGQENARQTRSLAQSAYDVKEGQDGNLYYVPKTPGGGQAQPVQGPNGPLTGQKGLSETQSNAAAFGMRAKAANDIINQLESSGVDIGDPRQLLAGNRVTNPLANDAAQKAQQAKLNFMTATLRKESGASISPSEFDTEDRKYFPQIGDSPAVREQKRQMRELAVETLKVQAGNQGARSIDASKGVSAAGGRVVDFNSLPMRR